MIEARIVEANDSFSRNLGARFGYLEDARSGAIGRNIGGLKPVIGAELGNTGFRPPGWSPAYRSDRPGTAEQLPAQGGFNAFNAGQFSSSCSTRRSSRICLEIPRSKPRQEARSSPARACSRRTRWRRWSSRARNSLPAVDLSGATSVSFRKANLSLKVKAADHARRQHHHDARCQKITRRGLRRRRCRSIPST